MRPKFRLVRGEGEASKTAELVIYDFIGSDPWSGGGVGARQVVDQLAGLGDVEQLDVRINSPGGDVADGTAIYNALSRLKAHVVVHVDGLAASIATLIAMAGDEIRTAENAMWMVHQPWTVAAGDAGEMRRTADVLDRFWSAMLTTYSRRTGSSAGTITGRVEAGGGEWWMTSAEAVEAGFADVVSEPERDVSAYGLDRFRRVPERLAAAATVGGENAPGDRRTAPRLPAAIEVAAPRVVRAAPGPDEAQIRRRRLVAWLST